MVQTPPTITTTTTITLPQINQGGCAKTPPPITVAAMSASVIARSYNDTPTGQPLFLPSATGSRSRPDSVQKPTMSGSPIRTVSSMKGERARAGAPSASGTRISFATDTSFHERAIASRRSLRSSSSSLNLRIVQGSERPSKARVRIPKATTATGMRRTSESHDEYLNPRKAAEIARSYGIPKFFLRSNSQQILTDGRMRLFADSIWKKERTLSEQDRQGVDSSDVVSRLMESVNRAIETSQKPRGNTNTIGSGGSSGGGGGGGGGGQMEVKTGLDDTSGERSKDGRSSVNNNNSLDVKMSKADNIINRSSNASAVGYTATSSSILKDHLSQKQRPHTVDPGSVSLTGYLPKVTFGGQDVLLNSVDNDTLASVRENPSITGGLRLKQLAAPFRCVSDLHLDDTVSDRPKLLEDKYHNVLPRFYPAVSAHRFRQQQAEADKLVPVRRSKKKNSQHRLVRFADANTVRVSNDGEKMSQDPLAGVVVRRAPVQSIQRALDSHSCFHHNNVIMDRRNKTKIADIQETGYKEEHGNNNNDNNDNNDNNNNNDNDNNKYINDDNLLPDN